MAQRTKAIACGKKIVSPITAEMMAAAKTAPAATSFAYPIFSFGSKVMASANRSMAVFSASASQTSAIARMIHRHSSLDRRKKIAAPSTATVAPAWIQPLCS